MTKGEVETAVRKAYNQLDIWNDVTGAVQPDSGYYYELQAVIEDAVHIGIQMALYGKVDLDEEYNVIKKN